MVVRAAILPTSVMLRLDVNYVCVIARNEDNYASSICEISNIKSYIEEEFEDYPNTDINISEELVRNLISNSIKGFKSLPPAYQVLFYMEVYKAYNKYENSTSSSH
jgi:hypothetical protein